MSIFTVLRGIWLRLTVFDRLVVWTVLFLTLTIAGLRLAGYDA